MKFRKRKPSAESRQERITAYMDGQLTAAEQSMLEADMAKDEALAAEIADLKAVKDGIRDLPRTRAPRNYTLDPATYGKPDRAWDLTLLPVLQGLTSIAALVFVFALVLNFLPTAAPTSESQVAEATRIVSQEIAEVMEIEEEADAIAADDEMAMDAPMAESAESIILESPMNSAASSSAAGSSVRENQPVPPPAVPAPTSETVYRADDTANDITETRLGLQKRTLPLNIIIPALILLWLLIATLAVRHFARTP